MSLPRSIAALIVTVGAVVSSTLVVAPQAAAAPADPLAVSALHTRGTSIVDAAGRVVLNHGVNNVDKEAPYLKAGDGFTVTAADAAKLAGYGFNSVRLGVSFDALMPTKGNVDEDYIGRVTAVVDMLADHGIRTLLDNHQDGMSSPWGGNGFPAWAVKSRPLPGEPNPGFPLYYLMPSMNAAWDEVWTNRNGIVDHLGTALKALAAGLKGHAGVMGIELLNEPWPGTAALTCFPIGCPLFDVQYQNTMSKLTRYVRQGDPTVPVYWEPNVTWNQMMPSYMGLKRIKDRNVVIAPHDYCIPSQLAIYLGLPAGLRSLCSAQQGLTWTHVDEVFRRTGKPVVITEFGDVDSTVLSQTLDRADKRFVGWTYWHYTSGQSLSGVARQLVRTYPQATAGRPGAMTFDTSTGAFSFTYRPNSAISAPTVIYPSSVHYPNGYNVQVTGGQYTTASDGRLHVSADGSGPVSVSVTAK
ncbi:cellulase family glycosylhydrolase [Gordonia sp. PDNC005]|uniref:endoglycoceramidase I n=1 Tax=unclassified Gordonia (in: high G+C Gram-positive bacteria) TaxID=2657482 RepID=UPI00196246EE|nr:cellulase family glycosylhydrolase [Gordonia sp. PDNC005]QRY63283.1 cellulase family glycosylhydrolase [Gordonia sp. PDNC005]